MKRFISWVLAWAIIGAPLASGQDFARILTGPAAENTNTNSFGVNWVDYDDDGRVDIFVTRWNYVQNSNRLYRNEGGGTFSRIVSPPLTAGGFSAGATWGDYDEDGDLDCFLANYVDLDNQLFRNEGGPDHAFADATTPPLGSDGGWSLGASWIDYDRDGVLDLSVPNWGTGIFLYRGLGGGLFERQAGSAVEAVPDDGHTGCIWGDLDDDGDQDLLVTVGTMSGYSGENRLFRNEIVETGTAGFSRITTDPITTNVGDHSGGAWIDYDNDGDLDCFVANWMNSSPDELYRNDGDGFVPVAAGAMTTDSLRSFMSVWGDFDNDGDLDGYVTTDADWPNRLYRNDGGGTFAQMTGLVFEADLSKSWGVASADYDDDGDLDLYVANELGPVNYLYRNDSDNGNHWLSIELEGGAHSNRSAFGSRIRILATIEGNPVWQIREVQAHNGVSCQNDVRAHFGLGDAASADSIVILWPSGAVTNRGTTAADQFLRLLEPTQTGVRPAAGPALGMSIEPNPLRTETVVRFGSLASGGRPLQIFDVRGRLVRSLDLARSPSAGAVVWDGRDDAGRPVAPGAYFLRIAFPGADAVRKAVVVR